MRHFWDWFQIASIILFLLILIAKAIFLRTQAGINPIAIGRGKKGFRLVFEIYAFLGLVVWMIEILLRGTGSTFRIFPSSIDVQLIDSPVTRVAGMVGDSRLHLIHLGLLLVW